MEDNAVGMEGNTEAMNSMQKEKAIEAPDTKDEAGKSKETAGGTIAAVGGTEQKSRSWYIRLLICCVSFCIVVGIVFLAFYVLGLEPFGRRALTTDDARIQYIDFFTYYIDVLHGTRNISYDFGNMLGWSPLGLFSYYLTSPFNLLLLVFGKEGVYRFFDIAVALKLGTAGAAFAWYLQRRFEDRILPAFVIALSMGYALMQYSVAQSSNIMWLDGVYMLPLMLLGVYEVIHRKSVWRLVLAVAFCILCNWYIAGVSCLFSGIWFFFEYFFQEGGIFRKSEPAGTGAAEKEDTASVSSRARRGEVPKKGFVVAFTDLLLSFCRYVWGMGLGVALSAVLFLPVISAMRQGKGQYDNLKIITGMSGDLLSAVRRYVIGADSARGSAALFCGGIAIVAAAALVFSGGYRIRQKAAYLCVAGICFLMLHWEPAMLAFSLMSRADSYWYRYSYLVCFVLLFGAGAFLSRAGEERRTKVLVPVLSVLYAAALWKLNGVHFSDFRAQGLEILRSHPALSATAGASLLLALLTAVLLWKKPFSAVRVAAGVLLIVVTGAELWANARILWQRKSDDSQDLYLEYSEGLQAQLADLRALDGGYYRIAQDRTRWHYEDDDLTAYLNESLAQNYWSNTAYTSSPDNAQLSLMWRLGYRDEAGRMLIVRDPVLPSDSFLGVKYLLESTPVRGLEPVGEIEAFSGRAVYRNPYALPMAFVYDGEKLPTRRYENTYVYQNALFSTLAGRKTELYTPLSWTRRDEEDKSYFSIYVPEGNCLVYGNLLWSSKKTGMMSINGAAPFGYCRWMSPASFLIRSREEQAQSLAGESLQAVRKRAAEQKASDAAEGKTGSEEGGSEESPLQTAAKAYDAEELAGLEGSDYADVRTVVFQSEEGLQFKDYQFYGLDLDVLREASETIQAGEVRDVTIENGHVTCSLEGTWGKSLCLLVPWSAGWEAFRNGEQVQPDTVAGTMITIPLADGHNEIELTYHIPYLREGAFFSLAALAALLIDLVCRWKAGRKE